MYRPTPVSLREPPSLLGRASAPSGHRMLTSTNPNFPLSLLVEGPSGGCTLCPTSVTHLLRALPAKSQFAEASLVEGPSGSCTLCPTFVTHLLRALPAKSQFADASLVEGPNGGWTLCPTPVTHCLAALPPKSQFAAPFGGLILTKNGTIPVSFPAAGTGSPRRIPGRSPAFRGRSWSRGAGASRRGPRIRFPGS